MFRYKTGNDASGELKRTAHRVRQVIDALPVTRAPDGRVLNPRRARLVSIPDPEAPGGHRIVAPGLDPRFRHDLMQTVNIP